VQRTKTDALAVFYVYDVNAFRYAYGMRVAATDNFYSRPWLHLENHVGTETK
jgi:hypothetical protein